jgi:hypothetical protein
MDCVPSSPTGTQGGLLITAGPLTPPLQVSVSPYSVETLASTSHDAELRPSDDSVHLHLDMQHMGVGGHDTWTPLRTVGERYFVAPTQRSLFRLRLAALTPQRGLDPRAVVSAPPPRPVLHSGTVVMFRALPATARKAREGLMSPDSEDGDEFASEFEGSPYQSAADSSPLGGDSEASPSSPYSAASPFSVAPTLSTPAPTVGTTSAASGGANTAEDVDVYLRVAGGVGVAPLPPTLPTANRYYGGIVVEKSGGGPVFAGNTLSLRGCKGYCIDVEGKAVAARWTVPGEWQQLQIELCEEEHGRGERLLRHGDVVCLRAHTGWLLRCPHRDELAQSGNSLGRIAALEASAPTHADAQHWELMMC